MQAVRLPPGNMIYRPCRSDRLYTRSCMQIRFVRRVHLFNVLQYLMNQASDRARQTMLQNKQGFSRVMHDPARGSVQKIFITSLVESDRVRKCSKSHESGRIGSGQEIFYQISRFGSGHPELIRPLEMIPNVKKKKAMLVISNIMLRNDSSRVLWQEYSNTFTF